ncbi:MAG: sigma-54 dependent transcriptional regulator [Acetobacteraceae bacterium]|nr:sigma-54 dependent transcriptional regulator [Acetobacteraceae bacterium]
MKQSPRGFLIIDLPDETAGQAAAALRERGRGDDHADGVAAALGLLPTVGRLGLVVCALSQDVPGFVEAIKREQLSGPCDAGGLGDAPEAWAQSIRNHGDRQLAGSQTPLEACEPMVICDPAMVALMRRVEDVAPSNATVLITGESGTGKELIAAHLHRSSGRQAGAFVAINCAGISDAQLESELFGHEKGAFLGAAFRHIGKFEAANGGTLLLDEIGEMDLRMQAKVLRAVQQREIDRVGGNKPVPIDVRIVATSSRNLQKDVRLGRFRADLLFRLNVITLRVPPLRERPADIAPLADFFARKFAQANGRANGVVSPRALDMLQQHAWPGNVRELENVMHRAVLTETGEAITAAALDIDTPDGSEEDVPSAVADSPEPPADMPAEPRAALPTAGRTIEAVEKDMILDTLRESMGNRSKTAVVLGISIRTLRNKLHEYERSGTRIPRPVVVAVS